NRTWPYSPKAENVDCAKGFVRKSPALRRVRSGHSGYGVPGRVGAIDILALIPKIRRIRHDLSAHRGPRTAGDRAAPQPLSHTVGRRPDSDAPGGHYPPRKPGCAATPVGAARFRGTVRACYHLLFVLRENFHRGLSERGETGGNARAVVSHRSEGL